LGLYFYRLSCRRKRTAFSDHASDFSHGGDEQHDVDIVVLFRLPFGAKLSERAALNSKRFSGGGSVSNVSTLMVAAKAIAATSNAGAASKVVATRNNNADNSSGIFAQRFFMW
jgi:hypothetical protein